MPWDEKTFASGPTGGMSEEEFISAAPVTGRTERPRKRKMDAFDRSVISGMPAEVQTYGVPELMGTRNKTVAQRMAELGEGVKAAGGNLAAAADVILNLPVQLMGIGADYGTRAAAIGSGETRRIGAQAGREAAGYVTESFGNPMQKLMRVLGYGEHYDESDVSKAMQTFSSWIDKGGEWVERKTGGGILKEDFASLADIAMASGGVKGAQATGKALQRGPATGIGNRAGYDAANAAEAARQAEVEASAAQAAEAQARWTERYQAEKTSAQAAEQAQAQWRQQYQPPGGEIPIERTPAQEQFLRENPQFRSQTQRAFLAENPQFTPRALEPIPPGVRSIPREEVPLVGQLPAALDTALEKVRAGERPTLTPEELIALREFERGERPPIVLPEKFRDAKGGVDPRLLAGLAALGLGSVIGNYLPDDLSPEAGLGIGLPFIGMGAVKEKGGMWHPEAVERLARPLLDKLSDAPENTFESIQKTIENFPKVEPRVIKMVRDYLNKHAGTATDPLKDVEIPSTLNERGTIPWGEAMDASLEHEVHLTFKDKVWDLEEPTQTREDIRSYLSHVGDYLRQNVAPEKLQQYDLVRAVKETAKWDADLAKRMAKERADLTAQMPVYKDYGNGYKWVEVKAKPVNKLPETWKLVPFTTEDVARVKKASGNDATGWIYVINKKEGNVIGAVKSEAEALEMARKESTEKLLKDEGDQMGHCVGGYCDWVESGDSKIYSLRDAKGKSHVTIEVQPEQIFNREPLEQLAEEHAAQRKSRVVEEQDYAYARKELGLGESIIQIKGKQNRAPVAEYLPYVQDFVKGGKWGEVGDLENSGLISKQDALRALNSRLQLNDWTSEAKGLHRSGMLNDFEQILGKETYVTQDQLNHFAAKWGVGEKRLEGPQNMFGQRGSIDPELSKILAGAGLGGVLGYLTSSDKSNSGVDAFLGALLGGGAMTAAGKRATKSALEKADVGFGMLSTRALQKSPELYRSLQDFVREEYIRGSKARAPVDAFGMGLRNDKLYTPEMQAMILREDHAGVRQALADKPELLQQYNDALSTIEQVARESRDLERFADVKAGRWPRVVKDYKGLRETLMPDARRGLEKELLDAEKESALSRGRGLDEGERSQIINSFLQRRGASSFLPNYAKARKIKDVTDAILPFYHDPISAAHIRLREMISDQEAQKFFGKNVELKEQGGKKFIDYDRSIVKVLDEEVKKGKLEPEDYYEIQGMLQSLFKGGTKQEAGWVQDIQNLFRAGLLGNAPAAVMQYSDLGGIAYAQDLKPTLLAVLDKVRGTERVKAQDFGLISHATEDFISNRRSAQLQNWALSTPLAKGPLTGAALGAGFGALAELNNRGDDKILKGSLLGAALGAINRVTHKGLTFAKADMVMKDVLLNAALRKGEALAKLSDPRLVDRYAEIYGDGFPKLVEDLKSGAITPEVSEYIWHEFTRSQPASKLERSQFYLQHPVIRPAAFLKSWMMKQADLVRRDAYGEMKKGNGWKGLGNLLRYGFYMGISGATMTQVSRWMLGYDDEISTSDIWENAAKTFALNEYTRNNIANRKIGTAIADSFKPPFKIFDDLARSTLKDPKTGEEFGDPRVMRFVPGWGPILYGQLFGGAKKHNERLAAQKQEADPEYQQRREAEQQRAREQKLQQQGLQPISAFREAEPGMIYSDTPGHGVQNYIEETSAMLRNRANRNRPDKNLADVRRQEILAKIEEVKNPRIRRQLRGTFSTYDSIRAQIDQQRYEAARRYKS